MNTETTKSQSIPAVLIFRLLDPPHPTDAVDIRDYLADPIGVIEARQFPGFHEFSLRCFDLHHLNRASTFYYQLLKRNEQQTFLHWSIDEVDYHISARLSFRLANLHLKPRALHAALEGLFAEARGFRQFCRRQHY